MDRQKGKQKGDLEVLVFASLCPHPLSSTGRRYRTEAGYALDTKSEGSCQKVREITHRMWWRDVSAYSEAGYAGEGAVRAELGRKWEERRNLKGR